MTEEERIFSGGLFSSEEPELVEKKATGPPAKPGLQRAV